MRIPGDQSTGRLYGYLSTTAHFFSKRDGQMVVGKPVLEQGFARTSDAEQRQALALNEQSTLNSALRSSLVFNSFCCRRDCANPVGLAFNCMNDEACEQLSPAWFA